MTGALIDHLRTELEAIEASGLARSARVIAGPQAAEVDVTGATGRRRVLNMCANNYLGFANDPRVVAAAKRGLEEWGFGLASVRFICGTQEIHRRLERAISDFLGTEDTILYSSCFDANGGLFETILGEEDAILSDALNHASLIDGIRLCKARRFRYANADTEDLAHRLDEARDCRHKLIVTDGVFSMDGSVAPLPEICDLAEAHGASVVVDDSHGVGVIGATGRGSIEFRGVEGRVDIVTGTLGKALGGAGGGYTSGRREVIEFLRQRSRPYIFSNTVPPCTVAASLEVLEILSASTALRDRLHENTRRFREGMTANGFEILPGTHPIVPVMLHDDLLARRMSDRLFEAGIYVIGFWYPIVPKGAARIRVQVSAAHSPEDIDRALDAFQTVRNDLG